MMVTVTSIDQLAQSILLKLSTSRSKRLVVIIFGRPGSGKTTVTSKLTKHLNGLNDLNDLNDLNSSKVTRSEFNSGSISSLDEIQEFKGLGGDETKILVYRNKNSSKSCVRSPFASHIKMDGFHLPLKFLESLPNGKELISKRGCPESFDAELVVKLVDLLVSDNNTDDIVSIPDFDHNTKDPENPGLFLSLKDTKIFLVEGLYLMLNTEPWNKIAKTVKKQQDSTLICQVKTNNESGIVHRVAQRHLNAGLVNDLQEGEEKYWNNDHTNGQVVECNSNTSMTDVVFLN